MIYEKYKESRNASWQVLLDLKINKWPIKVIDILQRFNISCVPYSKNLEYMKNFDVENNDGFSIKINNEYVIFYNDKNIYTRKRFTLAHELGHILLGHLENGEIIHTKEEEEQANIFARDLLAPAFLIHELKLYTKKQIAETFDVSYEFAEIRLKRIVELEKRNKLFIKTKGYGCFYLSPLEKELKRQFKKCINTYRRNYQFL